MHHDVFLRGEKEANRRDDVSVLVRRFNYPPSQTHSIAVEIPSQSKEFEEQLKEWENQMQLTTMTQTTSMSNDEPTMSGLDVDEHKRINAYADFSELFSNLTEAEENDPFRNNVDDIPEAVENGQVNRETASSAA